MPGAGAAAAACHIESRVVYPMEAGTALITFEEEAGEFSRVWDPASAQLLPGGIRLRPAVGHCPPGGSSQGSPLALLSGQRDPGKEATHSCPGNRTPVPGGGPAGAAGGAQTGGGRTTRLKAARWCPSAIGGLHALFVCRSTLRSALGGFWSRICRRWTPRAWRTSWASTSPGGPTEAETWRAAR